MRSLIHKLAHDESGMSFVYVGLGFMGFLAATTLAIDVGYFMAARSQAQNAADAGALAGAVALVFDSYADRSPSGPAVQSALAASRANVVMKESAAIEPSDVTFPPGPDGSDDRVRVDVYRTGARRNPLATLMGSFFGVTSADLSATATAEAAPANAATCIKPWIPPDRWDERQTPPWDPSDTFEVWDKKGNPLPNPDVYIPADDPGYTGYNATRDKGMRVTLKVGSNQDLGGGFFLCLALPGSRGGDDYRWNIANCNPAVMSLGDLATNEPGNNVGPTRQGVEELIAKDPDAYWDEVANRVVSTMQPSPRVVPVPVYDPYYYVTGKREGRNASLKVANIMGFFIEGHDGGKSVWGRITPIPGLISPSGGPPPGGAFPRVIRLVE